MKIVQFALADPVFMKNTSQYGTKIQSEETVALEEESNPAPERGILGANTRVLIAITDAGRCTYTFDMCNKGRHAEITAAGKSAAAKGRGNWERVV